MMLIHIPAGQLTDPAMLLYVLRRARASVPLYGGFDKLVRRLQKVALRVFGSADSGPRLQAALLIRSMAMLLPAPALDNALKARFSQWLNSVLRALPWTFQPISLVPP